MNSHYCLQRIMGLYGSQELKDIIKKWDNSLHNLRIKNINVLELLPNLFVKSKPGAGKTDFFKMLSEYLESFEFMNFYGDVKFFEFYFEYCPPHSQLLELNRLIEQIRSSAGFRNEYRGIIAIDITPWKHYIEEENFICVLEYLSTIDDKCMIIFTANNLNQQESERIERVLNAFCRIRSAELQYPSYSEFAAYCVETLQQYSLHLDKSAENLLALSIEKLMESEYFYGYRTVNRMCLDIAFDLGSEGETCKKNISEQDLIEFSKDSTFVEKLCAVSKIRQIGFAKR